VGFKSSLTQILTTIAAVLLVGCGPSVSINEAARYGNIEAVKQAIADGADVNAKDGPEWTALHSASSFLNVEVVELLLASGANVNAQDMAGRTPLDLVQGPTYVNQLLPSANDTEAHINNMLEIDMKTKMNKIGSLLRKHGGKTSEELKAEGK